MQKSRKILSITLLLGFGFFFLHSELNFLASADSGNHLHQMHAYCQLIKGAKIERGIHLSFKPITEKVFPVLDSNTDQYFSNKIALQSEFSRIKKKYSDTPIYLSNNILLI